MDTKCNTIKSELPAPKTGYRRCGVCRIITPKTHFRDPQHPTVCLSCLTKERLRLLAQELQDKAGQPFMVPLDHMWSEGWAFLSTQRSRHYFRCKRNNTQQMVSLCGIAERTSRDNLMPFEHNSKYNCKLCKTQREGEIHRLGLD